jgi:hypothetical protein
VKVIVRRRPAQRAFVFDHGVAFIGADGDERRPEVRGCQSFNWAASLPLRGTISTTRS